MFFGFRFRPSIAAVGARRRMELDDSHGRMAAVVVGVLTGGFTPADEHRRPGPSGGRVFDPERMKKQGSSDRKSVV